jgi:hypothetical protein
MGNEIVGWRYLFRRSLFDRPSPWPFDGSGPHARPRVPSPEGEGQEEGMEKPPSSGGSTLFNTASPLSKRETQWPKCFMEGERPPLAQRSGPSPLPGEGGAGWVDRQRYRRLVPFPFYPSQSPLQGRDLRAGRVLDRIRARLLLSKRQDRRPLPGEAAPHRW